MIRKFAKERDLKAVMDIWYEENCHAHPFIDRSYWESNISYVKEAICKADVYVFEHEEGVCAFTGIQDTFIEGFFVKGAFQRKGIGTRLMRFMMLGKMHLELSVYEKNSSAVKFYEKLGFVKQKQVIDQNTGEKQFIMVWKKKG